MTFEPGARLGPYEIEAALGAGGMGEVYRARDTRLDRTVALKILPPGMEGDPERMRRFTREARAAAALSHPNVAHIYEIDRSEGHLFIAMECVEGQRLDARIGGRPLAGADIADVAIQIADALNEAHNKGIIHRDIKPANIIVTSRGQVKVLDFGLAKIGHEARRFIRADSATQPATDVGLVLGTVRYMSPEQALGREVDHRSDIFSLGVVLYEMATGRVPFEGASTTETIEQIAHAQPEAVARFNYAVTPELERIIRKCLEKDPARRYQSARELEVDLRNFKRDSDSGVAAVSRVVSTGPRATRRIAALVTILVVVLAAVAAVVLSRLWSRSEALDSIAVLPFVNVTRDPSVDYLADGITENLINNLSRLSGLRVVPRGVVFRYKGREPDLQAAAADLDVRAVLTGRIIQRGDTLNVQAELIDVRRLSQLWGEQYNRKLADLLGIQQEITREISARLRPKLSGEEQQRLAKQYTASSEAYQAYLKGRFYWNKRTEEGFRKGIEYFQEAINRDPGYALAYAGLADSYSLLGRYAIAPPRESYPKAKAAASKALELDDTLVEAHTSLAYVAATYDWDWTVAEREYQRAIALNPAYATAHHWYGLFLASMDRLDEALAELQNAQQLEPLSVIITANLARTFHFRRDYDRALEWHRKALELDPAYGEAHLRLGWTYEQKKMYAQAIAEYQRALTASASGGLGSLGHAYGMAGRRSDALRVLGDLQERSRQGHPVAYEIALVYLGLGDRDKTFEWLRGSCQQRQSLLVWIGVDPQFDPVRSDPRFDEILRCVGLDRR